MRPRSGPGGAEPWWAALAAAAVLGTAACDPASETRTYDHLPEFCQDALPQVDSFMAERWEDPGDSHYGGTAVVGGIGDLAQGMNSLVTADYSSHQHQAYLNLMPLVRLNDQLEHEPYLARSWEISEDGTELVVELREDVRWHDGEPTTAEDVAFTFVRATTPETGFPNAQYLRHYVPGDDGVEVVDPHTVRFHLEPHADPVDPWRLLPILPEHLLGEVPPDELGRHPYGTRCPVGNGPFRFVEHREGRHWTFEANPTFPDELGGRPYLDRYVFRPIPEESTLLTELLNGDLDIYVSPTADQVEVVEEQDHLDLLRFQARDYVFVGWNTRRPGLDDPRVRRAITKATDRRSIVEAVVGGFGSVANAGVPPFHHAHMEELADSLTYDPDRAEELLVEAGWEEDGGGVRRDAQGRALSLEIVYNEGNQPRRQIAEIMQDQLGRVGIDVRPRSMEWATLADRVLDPTDRDFDGFIMAWVPEFWIDDTALFHSSMADRPYGWTGLSDPELDALLEGLVEARDREEEEELWEAYQYRILELQPFTYVYFRDRLAGVNRRLQGVDMDVRGEWVNVTRWWIDPDDRREGVAAR